MGYYIHYNETCGEARIHSGNCPQCNHGYASEDLPEQAPGKWIGPFNSYHSAEMEAVKANAEVLDCKHCI